MEVSGAQVQGSLSFGEVDVLRRKYEQHAFARDLTTQTGHGTPADLEQSTPAAVAARALEASSVTGAQVVAAAAGSSRLDRLSICSECRGLGVREEIYNHIKKHVTCASCSGDGVVELTCHTKEEAKEEASAGVPPLER
jgi:DnaJ-class molecular chaperone